MSALSLPRHPGLAGTTRLRPIVTDETSATIRDWLILGSAGILAACASTFLDLDIRRVPGHAILKVVFPMSAGLALVPRRGAGTVMGCWAFLTAMALRATGVHGDGMSLGALTSLTATGPILDWTLRRVNGGWRQYLAFGAAGLVSNLLALSVRGGSKLIGWEHIGGRPLPEWFRQAAFTYVLCGVLAGVISGVVLFYSRRPPDEPKAERVT